MKELFYQFLVENGALFNYLKYQNFNNIKEHEWVKCILIAPTLEKSWEKTDEGWYYWKELHIKWVKLYEKHMVEKFTTNK